LVSGLALLILVICLSFAWQSASAALGWVGGMSPGGATVTTISAGSSQTVSVRVWKNGVTNVLNFPNSSPNITCTLQYGPVGYFGATPATLTDVPMTYTGDAGNDDVYQAAISPAVGLYGFTVFCTDLTDSSTYTQGDGYGWLVVNPVSGACTGASQANNDIYWNGILHDSFSTTYRNPTGPVAHTQGTVTLRVRTCMDDVNTAPQVRVWNDRTNVETITSLAFDGHTAEMGGVTYWKIDLPIPTDPTALYYVFKVVDGTKTVYYRDDVPKFTGGGYGFVTESQSDAYGNSYQLTVYDAGFDTPAWMQRGVVYQIFPERFRDGDAANNPLAGRFFYNEPGGSLARSNQADWNYTICDPRSIYTPSCAGGYSQNFYGGDLDGITEKINQGYFDNLGVSVLYLNPIFQAPSNHKYDTTDYLTIDPDFGTLIDFQALVAAANAHNIKIILDGVFNHTSSDSTYFDRYSRYTADGACESTLSPYRSWFYLPDIGAPGRDGDPGSGPLALCQPLGLNSTTYEAWYGYSSLPKLQANSAAVRNLIWANGLSSVGPYWTDQGADGWRFDVGADVDPGLTNNPANDYWEGYRSAVRAIDAEALTLGEEWGDATPWLLGNEWDSVMNYRFRSALLSWLFTGCSGPGCSGGTSFEDNDSNAFSSSGAISSINPSIFNARLRSIHEDYPPMAFNAMMNLAGSHDTNRVRFLLRKVNNDSDAAAVQRMKEWWLFSYTYPGAPTLYYGDEIGLHHDGVYTTKWEDDPYNRVPFPWPDASGSSYGYGSGNDPSSNASNADLLGFVRHMASLRWSYRALQDGEVQHGIVIDDTNKLYGYARTYDGTLPRALGPAAGTQVALIVLNRDSTAHTATISGLNGAPYNLADGTVLKDGISGASYTVTGGAVTVSVSPTWGVILLDASTIETPAAPAGLSSSVSGSDRILSWNSVARDTNGGRELATFYTVHRSAIALFTPGAGNQIGTALPPAFGSANSKLSFTDLGGGAGTYYYIVCAWSAAGNSNCSSSYSPTAVTLADFSGSASVGHIALEWRTEQETGNQGFNIYRSDSPEGVRTKLNDSLIASEEGSSLEGAGYSFVDFSAAPGVQWYYWLETVSVTGLRQVYGPLVAASSYGLFIPIIR
jgi:glycosidase